MEHCNNIKVLKFNIPNDFIASFLIDPDCKINAIQNNVDGQISSQSEIEISIIELVEQLDTAIAEHSHHYGLFVWPSALYLSYLLLEKCLKHEFQHKTILELGCGTALPSLLLGKIGQTKKIYCSDRSAAPEIQVNISSNIHLNNLSNCIEFLPLDWGHSPLASNFSTIFQSLDVVIAADCFYQSQDYEKLFVTMAQIIQSSPNCKFYISYQLRSICDTIAPHLLKWNFTAKMIKRPNNIPDKSNDNIQDYQHMNFTSIYLYEIVAISRHDNIN